MAVHSKAVVLFLLLIHCLIILPLFVGVLFLVLVLLYITCNHHDEEEKFGHVTLFVYLMSCDCLCPVALPRGLRGLVCSV